MSIGVPYLHSHSGLERELRIPKHVVLIDAKYASLFEGKPTKNFSFGGVDYVKVNTLSFARKRGVFKNLNV